MIEGKSESLLSTFWYLQKKKKYGIKIVSIDRLLNKEQFYKKRSSSKCASKTGPRTHSDFDK